MRFTRILFVFLCILICIALLGTIGILGVYAYFARTLPAPSELYELASSFQNTRIMDADGQLLYEFYDPSAGLRVVTAYENISPLLIDAVVATEDPTFFSNVGVNPLSIARAFYQNLRAGYVVSGASTITQQVAKNVFLSTERTYTRKIEEAILATELTRTYSKEQILGVYLNESYFGNMAYGIGAASETYFGKTPDELTLAEAALLAGLLQSPVGYDPYTNPDVAIARRATVLSLMQRRGYITATEAVEASAAPLGVVESQTSLKAPHLVIEARSWLEKEYGTEYVYEAGLQVQTTIDSDLQEMVERDVTEGIAQLDGYNANNASVVVLDPTTGDILAMVGSADFYDASINGQINMATTARQTGSAIKPFTYLAALEQGYTAASLLMDIEQEFPDGVNSPYVPTNYDLEEWGPISLRTALANSRNIPVVQVLNDIGVDSLLEICDRLGIELEDRDDYGLSLTLGSGEATLLDMTQAFGVLANGGALVRAHYLSSISDSAGQIILDQSNLQAEQVVDARLAYIITDILSDDEERMRAFGTVNNLDVGFTAAVKTGTTNDYRDSWAIGYTSDIVVGVWVGNADNSEMTELSGSRGAGLIWNMIMSDYYAVSEPTPFAEPEGLVTVAVCPVSGELPGAYCPDAVEELFTTETAPTMTCTVHKTVQLCNVTNKLALSYCPNDQLTELLVTDFGEEWDEWAISQGYTVPPREYCDVHTSPSLVELSVPSVVSGVVDIYGTTMLDDFSYYVVELGYGSSPGYWSPISPSIHAAVSHSVLYRWDTRSLSSGDYSLRLVVYNASGWQQATTTTCYVQN